MAKKLKKYINEIKRLYMAEEKIDKYEDRARK